MAGAQTEDQKEPAVTFEDVPGDIAFFDKMFPTSGDRTPKADVVDSDEEDAGEADATPAVVAPDLAVQAQIRELSAQNQKLAQQVAAQDQARSVERLAGLMTQYEDAVATGQVTVAEKLRTQIVELKSAPAPVVTTPTTSVISDVPAGHWAQNIVVEATEWMAKQAWWGVDAPLMKGCKDAAEMLQPGKFAKKEDYFAAVLKSAKELIGREKPAQKVVDGGEPQPRVLTNAQRGASNVGVTDVTSIKQLKGEQRTAAEDAMRYGNISEKVYLDSFNALRRQHAKRK